MGATGARRKPSGSEVADYVEASVSQTDDLPWSSSARAEIEEELKTDKLGIGPVGRTRDSTLLDTSNWDVIEEDLRKRFPDDVTTARFGHWAVGWVEELVWRAYDPGGGISAVAKAVAEWAQKLEDYPSADDEHYSELELNATTENIEQIIRHLDVELKAGVETGDAAGQVYSWLSDHDQGEVENRDDQGGYPSDEAVTEALLELGLATEEESDGDLSGRPSHDDIEDFRGFVRRASDRQLQHIYDKEMSAGRRDYATVVRAEAERRRYTLDI